MRGGPVLVRALIGGALVFGPAASAGASEFFAIVANLTGAPKPHAQIDVGVDTSAGQGVPVGVEVTVFGGEGSLLDQFVVMTDPVTGFASTASALLDENLFTISAGLPALVRIRTPAPDQTGTTVLRQTLGKSRVILGVPVAKRGDGTVLAQGRTFGMVTGDIIQKATLLVANVSGGDAQVEVFVGTKGIPGHGKYTTFLGNMSVWILELDPTDAHSHLVVASTEDVVVQLAVEEGSKGTVTGVTVLPVD